MHVSQCFLHLGCREHVDVLESERLHDILLEVVVQPQAADTLNEDSRPIDVDAVFPYFAGLVHKRLTEIIPWVARELI